MQSPDFNPKPKFYTAMQALSPQPWNPKPSPGVLFGYVPVVISDAVSHACFETASRESNPETYTPHPLYVPSPGVERRRLRAQCFGPLGVPSSSSVEPTSELRNRQSSPYVGLYN